MRRVKGQLLSHRLPVSITLTHGLFYLDHDHVPVKKGVNFTGITYLQATIVKNLHYKDFFLGPNMLPYTLYKD